jgi:WD40 repeat protein
MIKPDNMNLTFAYGHSNDNKRTNICFYTNEDEPRVVYLIGRQIVIEKFPKDNHENSIKTNISMSTPSLEFVQFNESINKSLLKHSNYRYQNFCYDKVSKRGFINIKIMDENTKRYPKLLIFELKDEKSSKDQRTFKLDFFDSKTDYFVNVCFAPNSGGRYLIALTKNQPQHVFFYDINAMRILGISPISKEERWEKVTACPNDVFLILLTSKTQKKIRILRINDNLPVSEINLKYCLKEGVGALEWISNDIFAVADSSGFAITILAHEKKSKFEILQRIDTVKIEGITEDFIKNSNIIGLRRFSKGLVVYTSVNLFFVLIRKEEFIDHTGDKERGHLMFYSCFKFEAFESFMPYSVDFTLKEDEILVSFEKQALLSMPTDEFILPPAANLQLKKLAGLKVLSISDGFQILQQNCGGVSQLMCSDHAPTLIASRDDPFTLGIINPVDKLNNFDFTFQPKSESSKVITAEFHPSGHYIVCSFKDKIQGFNISLKKLFLTSENNNLKGSYLLRFSDGGGLLACCHLETKNNFYPISLMESYSLNILKSVNTHSHSNRISDLLFSSISTYLWSSSVDGCLFAWSLPSFHKKEVLIEKEMKFICMDLVQGNDLISKAPMDFVYILSEDTKGAQYIFAQQIENSDKIQKVPLPTIIDQGVPVRHTFIKSFNIQDKVKGIVLGNNLGYLVVYPNITNLSIPSSIIYTPCSQEITKIAFSQTKNSLTVASKEGILAVYSINTESAPKGDRSYITNEEYLSTGDQKAFIMVDYEIIRTYESQQRQDRQRYEEKLSQLQLEASESRFRYGETMRSEHQKFDQMVAKKNEEIDFLTQKNQALEQQYANLIKSIESDNLVAVEEIEKLYEAKINHQAEKLISTEKNEKLEKLKYEKIIADLKAEKEKELTEMDNRLKTQLNQQTQKNKVLTDEISSMISKQESDLAGIQTEHDNIVTQMKHQNLSKIKTLEDKFNSCRKDFQTVKNDRDGLKAEKEAIQKELASKDNTIHQMNIQIRNYEYQMQSINSEKESLKEVISAQDEKLSHFAKIIEDLEKTKNVLTFRTAEMRKGMEPKEQQIDKLKAEVIRLEGELEQILKKLADKETLVSKKCDEVKSAQTIIQKLNNDISEKDSWIKNIATIVTNCVTQTEPKSWGVYMKKLYSIITERNQINDSQHKTPFLKKENIIQQQEISNQIHCLQNKIQQLNKNKQKSVVYHTKHLENKTEENATLLSELNILRINYKNLHSLKNSLAITNGQLQREVKVLQNELKKFNNRTKGIGPVSEPLPKDMKESGIKINNSFKIKSVIKNKTEAALPMLDELLNEHNKVDEVLDKMSPQEKDVLISSLLATIH